MRAWRPEGLTRRQLLVGAGAAAVLQTAGGLPHAMGKDRVPVTKLPSTVVAGYWTYWADPIRLIDLPGSYNTVFLFHATPVGGAPGSTGAVQWNTPGDGRGAATNFTADLAAFRTTRTAILSVGGAGANVDIASRDRAQALLTSVHAIYDALGGFDGVDWNNYEGTQVPNTEQMIWVSEQLKRPYGVDFALTPPPAPWRDVDRVHCRSLLAAGVMDLVCPQFYDGPQLAGEDYIVRSVDEWVRAMGDAANVGVGFGLDPGARDFSTTATVVSAWRRLRARHSDIRGGFNWDVATDERLGWPFATHAGDEILHGLTLPPVILPVVPARLRRALTSAVPVQPAQLTLGEGK